LSDGSRRNLAPLPSNFKYFPYEKLRYNQAELIRSAKEAIIDKKHLIVRAPAGFGKTPCILAAALQAAEKLNLKIMWICRTHRESDRVIDEVKKISTKHTWISGLSIRARSEMCLLPIDSEIRREVEAFSIMCSELKKAGKCPYYNETKKKVKVYLPKVTSASEIIEICSKHSTCPYEMARRQLPKSTIIALNYLYALKPEIFNKLQLNGSSYILIIDEAHNLPEIATQILSEKITANSLRQTVAEAEKHGVELAINIGTQLLKFMEKETEEKIISKKQLTNIIKKSVQMELSDIANALLIKGLEIRRKLALKGKLPRSHIHHLGKFIALLQTSLKKPEHTIILRSGELELVCFDPRRLTRKLYKKFHSTISLSGTINADYGEIVGIKSSKYMELSFNYSSDQVLPIVATNVTSDYDMRSPTMYRKMAEYIIVTAEVVNSGIGVFTASYEVLNGLINAGVINIKKPMFIEREGLPSRMSEHQIRQFKEKAKRGGAIYLGVCGGRASEGEDFPGSEMDVVILAGIPFPEPTLTLKAKVEYYEKRFPRKARLYSYILPSLWKAAQAAGRVMRGPDDRGAIIYLDKRYLKYGNLMPTWMRPRKTIKEAAELKEELCLFFA